jgi:hypothetical protein
MAKRSLKADIEAARIAAEADERARILAAPAQRSGAAATKRRAEVLEAAYLAEKAARELAIKWLPNRPQVHKIEPLKLRNRSGRTGLPMLVTGNVFSDWHVEERVDPAMVNGLNDYDLDEAERRMGMAWRGVAKLVKKEQAAADVRTHVCAIIGDLFSGEIHPDTIEVGQLSALESVFWLRERVTAGLRFLCENLDVEELVVVWTYGNHGRNTMKPRVATAAEHNYEWLLGQFMQQDILQQPWAKKKRMRFIAERGYHTYLDLNGFVVRYHHGDNVRFQGGVGGLSIPLNKAIAQWNTVRKANLDVIGHWHQETDMAHAIVNGSLIGWNAYANSIKATFEEPKQSFFEIDLARRCKSGYFTVHVTPKPGE